MLASLAPSTLLYLHLMCDSGRLGSNNHLDQLTKVYGSFRKQHGSYKRKRFLC